MAVGGGDLYGFSVGGVAVRWSLMKGGVLGRLASPVQFSVFRYLSLCLGLSDCGPRGLVSLAGWLAGWSLARSWSSTSTLSPTAPPFLLATRNHNVYLTDSLPVPALWSYYGSSVDLHMPPVPPPFYVPFLEQVQISLVGRDKPGTSSMISHRLPIKISVRSSKCSICEVKL